VSMSVQEINSGFNRRPLNRLNSPTLTVTDADKDQNSTFNTNLGSIETGFAMYVHRIQVQCNIQSVLVANLANLYVGILSENTSATSALTEANNPASLFIYERDFHQGFTTSGFGNYVYDAIQNFNLDPWPIITVAQSLNVLCELTEATAASSPDVIFRVFLWYTLEPVTDQLRQRLLERITLSTT